MAGHEASLPHTAVDTVLPMTRGGDKLRTVCGRLRRNTAREWFYESSYPGRFAAGRSSGHGPVVQRGTDLRPGSRSLSFKAADQMAGHRARLTAAGIPACRCDLLTVAAIVSGVPGPGRRTDRAATRSPHELRGNTQRGKSARSCEAATSYTYSVRCAPRLVRVPVQGKATEGPESRARTRRYALVMVSVCGAAGGTQIERSAAMVSSARRRDAAALPAAVGTQSVWPAVPGRAMTRRVLPGCWGLRGCGGRGGPAAGPQVPIPGSGGRRVRGGGRCLTA
jgi:hypothetical protein